MPKNHLETNEEKWLEQMPRSFRVLWRWANDSGILSEKTKTGENREKDE